MKKFLTVAFALLCACAIVQAQDAGTNTPPKKAKMTAEQKALQAEMLAKYDTDKNGKLSKAERDAMSQEDKDKMAKAGLGPKKKAPATDAAPAANK